MGLLGSLFSGILGAVQLGKAGKINPQYSQYKTSPYAEDNLANAENAYNGRMAGATEMEQNILANQAGANAAVDRSATDGSQALAVKAANVGQTNQAFHNVQTQEAQNKYAMLNNLNMANQNMVTEGDKEYQSKLQKYMMDVQQQAALRQSGITNLFGAINGVGNDAMSYNYMRQNNSQGQNGGVMSMLPFIF